MADTISEADFQERAATAIEELEASFGKLSGRGVEADLQAGVLKVTFDEPEEGTFVISPNGPARQVWVSARLTSWKFDWLPELKLFALHGTKEPLWGVLQRLTREQLHDPSVDL